MDPSFIFYVHVKANPCFEIGDTMQFTVPPTRFVRNTQGTYNLFWSINSIVTELTRDLALSGLRKFYNTGDIDVPDVRIVKRDYSSFMYDELDLEQLKNALFIIEKKHF